MAAKKRGSARKPASRKRRTGSRKSGAKKRLFSDYLMRLCTRATAWRRHQADPEGAMRKAGLSKSHIDAVMSKDPRKVRDAVVAEHPPNTMVRVVHINSNTALMG